MMIVIPIPSVIAGFVAALLYSAIANQIDHWFHRADDPALRACLVRYGIWTGWHYDVQRHMCRDYLFYSPF